MTMPARIGVFTRTALYALVWGASALASAAGPASTPPAPVAGAATTTAAQTRGTPVEFGVSEWLLRMHAASQRRAYIGTFVVSAGATMSSARIWHVCDGEQQIERVESLTGAPRSTFRHNDQVITFLPDSKTALSERRESLGLFPDLLKAADSSIGQFYSGRQVGAERVAGVDADLVLLQPKDAHRYGYRVWSEKKSGMVVKLQTLDVDGRVLEQSAFSELQLDAPVSMAKLTQMMANTDGYRVERQELVKTTAAAEGWALKAQVAGFKPMDCYKRPAPAPERRAAEMTLQCVFSDGLASLSLFVESHDRRRHAREGLMSIGATQMLTRHLSDKSGEWWLTVVGEVPRSTLGAFSQGLERTK